MTNAQDHPFVRAFAEWFETAHLGDIMTFEPAKGDEAVEIDFLIGDGALHGYAHPAGLSISASRMNEAYDMLWDDDLIANHGPRGWSCSLCPPTERQHFPMIEALWIAHLFDPLRRWVDEQLRPAVMLEFHRHDGATWAKLHQIGHQSNGSISPTWQVALCQNTLPLT